MQYKIGITLIPDVGDITGKKLIAYCGGVEAVFKEKKQNLLKIPGIGEHLVNSILKQDVLKRAEQEIAFIKKYNITPFFYLDKQYPERLKHCIDSPMMLYFKGNADLNATKIISVVGTRKPTEYGIKTCNKLIKDLTSQNVLIVSGLAYGIDSCSHKAALKNNLKTIGVLAHGLDIIYPSLNKSLAEKMVENGGLITEFISKTKMDPAFFPRRNRIIAGLADAVIVVESGIKGGSLITANIANSYSRDVFAVPGKNDDKYSVGCNHLIKINKAALFQSAEDVIYIMGWEKNKEKNAPTQRELFVKLKPNEEILVKLLKENGDSDIDYLCLNANLTMSKVAAALLSLEFSGIIKGLPGKMYSLQ